MEDLRQGRRIAHRLIWRQGRGLNTIVGLDAVIAANLGQRGSTDARVSTTHRVVQGAERAVAASQGSDGRPAAKV